MSSGFATVPSTHLHTPSWASSDSPTQTCPEPMVEPKDLELKKSNVYKPQMQFKRIQIKSFIMNVDKMSASRCDSLNQS